MNNETNNTAKKDQVNERKSSKSLQQKQNRVPLKSNSRNSMRKTHVATVTISSRGSQRPSLTEKQSFDESTAKLHRAAGLNEAKSSKSAVCRDGTKLTTLKDVEQHEPFILTQRTKPNQPGAITEFQQKSLPNAKSLNGSHHGSAPAKQQSSTPKTVTSTIQIDIPPKSSLLATSKQVTAKITLASNKENMEPTVNSRIVSLTAETVKQQLSDTESHLQSATTIKKGHQQKIKEPLQQQQQQLCIGPQKQSTSARTTATKAPQLSNQFSKMQQQHQQKPSNFDKRRLTHQDVIKQRQQFCSKFQKTGYSGTDQNSQIFMNHANHRPNQFHGCSHEMAQLKTSQTSRNSRTGKKGQSSRVGGSITSLTSNNNLSGDSKRVRHRHTVMTKKPSATKKKKKLQQICSLIDHNQRVTTNANRQQQQKAHLSRARLASQQRSCRSQLTYTSQDHQILPSAADRGRGALGFEQLQIMTQSNTSPGDDTVAPTGLQNNHSSGAKGIDSQTLNLIQRQRGESIKASSFASKKLSVKTALSISKSTPPFKIADDAEMHFSSTISQVIGIQRPKPLLNYLTVPVLLRNQNQPRSQQTSIIKQPQKAEDANQQQQFLRQQDPSRQIDQGMKEKNMPASKSKGKQVSPVDIRNIGEDWSEHDFSSFDEGDNLIGDEQEDTIKVKEFDCTLRQLNTKQWYENMDGSEVVFQVGNSAVSHTGGLFESASSKQNPLMLFSDAKSSTYTAGNVKFRGANTSSGTALQQQVNFHTSMMPTNETRKNQLVFFSGGHHHGQASGSIFECASNSAAEQMNSTAKQENRHYPITSAFNAENIILVENGGHRDAQDVGLKEKKGERFLSAVVERTELIDNNFTTTTNNNINTNTNEDQLFIDEGERIGGRGIAAMNESKQKKMFAEKQGTNRITSSMLPVAAVRNKNANSHSIMPPLPSYCLINQNCCGDSGGMLNQSPSDDNLSNQRIKTIINRGSSQDDSASAQTPITKTADADEVANEAGEGSSSMLTALAAAVKSQNSILTKVNFQRMAPKEVSSASSDFKPHKHRHEKNNSSSTVCGGRMMTPHDPNFILSNSGSGHLVPPRFSDVTLNAQQMVQEQRQQQHAGPPPTILHHYKSFQPAQMLSSGAASWPGAVVNGANKRAYAGSFQVSSSNQSSICKFAPRHTEDEAVEVSPYKGKYYQHCQSNEELISAADCLKPQQPPIISCELAESIEHSAIENRWTDLKAHVGLHPSSANAGSDQKQHTVQAKQSDEKQLTEAMEDGAQHEQSSLLLQTTEENQTKSQGTSAIHQLQFNQTIQSLMYLNQLPDDLTDRAIKRLNFVNLPAPKQSWQTKTLIFDLDETLAHCLDTEDGHTPEFTNQHSKVPQHIVQIICQNSGENGDEQCSETIEAGINLRPYVRECLSQCGAKYQVGVFTASHQEYADAVIDLIDPEGTLVNFRLYREHCFQTDEGIFIKDLRVIRNRDLKDLILIDNSVFSFGFQLDNGIPIIPYFNDPSDQELVYLAQYVLSLSDSADVREQNAVTFQLEEFKRASLSCYQQQAMPTLETFSDQQSCSNSAASSSAAIAAENQEEEKEDDQIRKLVNRRPAAASISCQEQSSVGSRPKSVQVQQQLQSLNSLTSAAALQRGRRNETIAEVSYEGGDSETSTSQLLQTNSRISMQPMVMNSLEYPIPTVETRLTLEATSDSLYSQQQLRRSIGKPQGQAGPIQIQSEPDQEAVILHNPKGEVLVERSSIDQKASESGELAHMNVAFIEEKKKPNPEQCSIQDQQALQLEKDAVSSEQVASHSSEMTDINETDILAAKKRLNFYDEKKLNNPLSSMYGQSMAQRRQGHRMRKQLYPFAGDSQSSSELLSHHNNSNNAIGSTPAHMSNQD